MLDRITELSPDFQGAYQLGALFLSVVVDDRRGAQLLFEKGLRRFPENGSLAYQAAYHYLYELQDPHRAAQLLEMAGRSGVTPPWVFSLAARLYSKSGQVELGIQVLEEALRKDLQGFGKERVQKRLLSLYHQWNQLRRAQGLGPRPIPWDLLEPRGVPPSPGKSKSPGGN